MARLKIDADLDALKGGKSASAMQFDFPGQSWVGDGFCGFFYPQCIMDPTFTSVSGSLCPCVLVALCRF